MRSLLHLTRHTHVYVPLAPYLLPVLTSTLSASSKPKPSTLRPLDFETNIRAPQQYLKTRVYNEGLAEESAFLLAEYLASPPVQGSIGFPEIVVPITLLLRKAIKSAKGAQGKLAKAKETGVVKVLVDRIDESAQWVEQKRKSVLFAPGKTGEVERWEDDLKVEDSPLARYVKVQRKAREKRRKLVEKVRVLSTPVGRASMANHACVFTGERGRGGDARGLSIEFVWDRDPRSCDVRVSGGSARVRRRWISPTCDLAYERLPCSTRPYGRVLTSHILPVSHQYTGNGGHPPPHDVLAAAVAAQLTHSVIGSLFGLRDFWISGSELLPRTFPRGTRTQGHGHAWTRLSA